MTRYIVRLAGHALIAVLFVGAALLGSASGVLFAYTDDLPQISALDDYAPSTITRVYASGGELIGEYAIQRRVVVDYDSISPRLVQAIMAAEDAEFQRHFGLSISRILVTLVKDILERRKAAGASTLTQQLARTLFLTPEKTWERKIKEAILAIQIEKRYTKREIFTLYCNQIYLGHGAYGFEAASRLYFNKHAKDLLLDEAAMLAGIIQSPERQSPFVDMRRAIRRRNYVLDRMADEGFISRAEAAAAERKPTLLRGGALSENPSIAPYFVEEVRKYLEAKYGAKRLYESGLAVHTSLDVHLQAAASQAVERGLRDLDKRRGFRKPVRNVLAEGSSIERHVEPRWQRPIAPGDIVPAVVVALEGPRALVRFGRYRAVLDKAAVRWTRRPSAAQLVKPGDLIEVQVDAIDDGSSATVRLEQTPIVEGALLAIDNRTGQIRAMVGGFRFERSKFNRAAQAYRQLGSLFKAFVYTAAIDRGYTPSMILMDAPASYAVGPGQPMYSPMNYDHTFEGPITLRHALEKSRNVPAVRVMDQLGPRQVIAYARKFGFESPMQPYLSTALGASEATLLEVTSAYSVFPNQGVRMQPYSILKVTDREANVLEENRPEPTEAIRADTAFVMTNLLRGVVERGTAARAGSIQWPLAGKTGTVDEFTDAWFIGFDPHITAGVWVGHDEKKPLGPREDGAHAALPIWIDFMELYIKTQKEVPEFSPPANIIFLHVDRATGDITPDAPDSIHEAFISGTQPGSAFKQ
ncbi:MAG: PBP1A family penicillin-binding protein [Acidobacteria bacterium]|nr:PBP1A family penicillin-binding protein [Acidobacteriota bacterium]